MVQLPLSEDHGHPQIGSAKTERSRHDPHDGVIAVVQDHRLAEDLRIAAEAVLPQAVAQDHHRLVGALFRIRIGATQHGIHTEHREKAGGGAGTGDPFGRTSTSEIVLHVVITTDVLEDLVLVPPVEIVGSRPGCAIVTLVHRLHEDLHQPAGVFVGQGVQEDAVDDGEDGAGGTDANGQSQHHDCGEAGTLEKCPRSVAKILNRGLCCSR